MKKTFFFASLVAASLLASCSSDDVVASQGNNEYGMIAGQPAFLSLGIAMPDDPASRSNSDTDLKDGDGAEYDVKSGRLVLFKGSSEATATYFESYDITDKLTSGWTTESSAQITTTSQKFVQEIKAPSLSGSEKLFAYVILNDKSNVTLSLGTSTTFSDFSKQVFKAIGISDETKGYGAMNDKGLVMTSVPISKTPGQTAASTGAIQTLTPIEASAVYTTAAEAEDAGAEVACCYVERAAAKVQLKFKSGIADPTGDGTPTIDVNNVKWGLGNVNSSGTNSGYYNTRQVDQAWGNLHNERASYEYRFVSGTKLIASGHEDGYRTFFGSDVNYDGNTGLIGSTMDAWPNAVDGVTYTYENTFNENSQIYANTTYVGLQVELNNGADFYTIDGQNNTALTETKLKTALAGKISDQIGTTTIATINATIAAQIAADLANPSGVLQAAGFNPTDNIEYDLGHEVSVGTTRGADGSVTYTDKLVLNNVKVNSSVADAGQLTAINSVEYATSTTIASKLATPLTGYTPEKVYMYEGGVAYYATRIGHFHDIETPWNTEAASYNDYEKIYPSDGQALGVSPNNYGASRADAWLGRWGVVRNNWYCLTVDEVNGIGDPVPVDYSGTAAGTPGATPDDNPTPKYYIAAHIHILPWVLREQTVKF